MNVDWDRICDFVFDTFGDDNAEMARYSLIEFGIDPDTRRPIVDEDYTPRVHTVSCGCVVCRRQRRRTPRALDAADLCDCGEPFPESGYCKFCGARQRQRQ